MVASPFQLRVFYQAPRIPPEMIGRWLPITGRLFSNRFYLKNPGFRRTFVETLRRVAKVKPHEHLIAMRTLLEEASRPAPLGASGQYYEKDAVRHACLQLFCA
jgi:hypothetical protein